ncbi:MAG: phage minor capsid protein [Eubacterium sp.]|nr:phage minor capsid protein [Eubacterium sp.]
MPKYVNGEYDIEKAFRAIEDELIHSMIRNFKQHRAEETKEGYNWSAWQIEQLKSLEQYKKANAEKFSSRFSNINASVEELIKEARVQGDSEQEEQILKAIKNGFKAAKPPGQGMEAAFFRLNDKKIEALVKATTKDLSKAEHATLRMANDKYRQIIFNAQVYANTGAGTYEKAVDMATRDFLSAGINSIEYKDGSRHNIKEYAGMAIRTADKRAYLTGEGEKRKEWGVTTVIVKKRGNACPKCLPFCGKILIDDVWSGGVPDGKHKLMSQAIAAGLYHPNCKDIHTTYFEGITKYGEPYTDAELKKIESDYNEEQKQKYAQRQAERFDRLEKYSLDDDNKKIYAARREQWEKQVDSKQEYKPVNRGESKIVEVKNNTNINISEVEDYKGEVYISDKANIKPRALHEIYNNTMKAMELWGISKNRRPEIRIVSYEELEAYGKYNAVDNVVYYIPEVVSEDIVGGKAITEYHEMWHMKQAEKFRSKGWNITKENYGKYIRELNKECKKTIDVLGINEYNVGKISDYAEKMLDYGRYDEVEAEYMTIIKSKGKEL